ncbi:hypothetical protein ABT024_26350 [Streptomyces sp. NPDC002812]|uniref:hypothetical protein n=1 Tax=unclassified Streptomyces TaxID=2593676 RepID=UPI0020309D15|nr:MULTISPECIES: hypothetical protein [unclassified Streptomyces]MCM1966268.1 hypothetical protein [Streptomyces sp. G1]MCX5125879.1 hypothetical protein [Streptomyces sp. NBC_00347]MCX5298314.1 hypothetical protein [Streptomyces sp. NBC_00193]
MTHVSRKPRLVLFAASAAIVAGGVLAPATALAATPAGSHAVTADDTTGNESTLLLHSGPDDTLIRTDPPAEDTPGKWGKGKHKRPGKHGSPESPPVFQAPDRPEWQCITAPCGPPEGIPGGGTEGGTTIPRHVKT